MHVHAFSMYIAMGMLNRIQEQVPVISPLTDQLRSQSLCHCTPLQLHNNAAALTSSLHHLHYIRSCQTSLSMLLKLMPNCKHLCARLSTTSQNKDFSLMQLLFCFSLETPGKSAQNTKNRYEHVYCTVQNLIHVPAASIIGWQLRESDWASVNDLQWGF